MAAAFTSNEVLGVPIRNSDPETLRLWGGLSAWATEAQARRNARRFPSLGAHIAAIRLERGAPIRVERTRGPGHHTLWGEPDHFLTRVISVVEV
jgi:pimeloyl-ACP methyl ester carboxylesterase